MAVGSCNLSRTCRKELLLLEMVAEFHRRLPARSKPHRSIRIAEGRDGTASELNSLDFSSFRNTFLMIAAVVFNSEILTFLYCFDKIILCPFLKASMQFSNLMPFAKATWSTWQGPDSEDFEAFRGAAWHQRQLKSTKIGHIALNSFGNLTRHILIGRHAMHLRKICPEVSKYLSKMDLSPLS